MVALLIIVWVLIFAPLVIMPFLPRVEGAHSPAPRLTAARQVVAIAAKRQDRAA